MPIVNASLDEADNEIVLHDRYHIGIAVATPGGLIVPVIHDADKRDLGGVAREIERLGNDARAGKQRLEDLRGGTFTVTSVGNIGGLFSTPVINHPEVGILGVGNVVKRPVFDAHGARAAGGSASTCRCRSIIASWTGPSAPPSPTPSSNGCKTRPCCCCRISCEFHHRGTETQRGQFFVFSVSLSCVQFWYSSGKNCPSTFRPPGPAAFPSTAARPKPTLRRRGRR